MKKSILANKEFKIEIHPDWYFNIPEMKVLILGSYPPHLDKWSFPFYYPNKQNNFWKILAAINNAELNYFEGDIAVNERKQLMRNLKIGVQNMGKVIYRKGKSSLDADIEIKEFQDILAIIKKHPELKKIILSGYSAKNSTYYAFIQYLKENNIEFKGPVKIAPGNLFVIKLSGRTLSCVIVNSTSTTTRMKLEYLIEQFSLAIRI